MKSILLASTLLLTSLAVYAADDPPDWVREAANQETPKYSAKVSAVVLFHEEVLTVEADGRRVMRERQAVKVLQRGGEPLAAMRVYNVKSGKIRDFQGWLVPPAGKPSAYAKNRFLDVALSRDYVYDEARMKILEAGDAPAGSIFAWEIIEEEKTVFTQDMHEFQRELPVLVSRFVLRLPPGWEVNGVIWNTDPVEQQVSGASHTWEFRNLPFIEKEDFSPSLYALVPRLALTYYPPAGNRAGLPALNNWASVSRWVSGLVDPPAEPTDPVRAKANQLTASSAGDLDKIRAIASFVQQTNYVEVALNITKGGGYTPRLAEETLVRNYGDCKDKVTLMRALLKGIGIESYLTTIFSGDSRFVRPDWASPMQFNHAIIAVRIPNGVELTTVLQEPRLGRLLMFDPTDPFTPVGDLPETEQGRYALILAGDAGALVKMPHIPASENRVESTVEAVMDPGGRIEARLQKQYFGQSGVPFVALRRLHGDQELQRSFEKEWSRQLIGLVVPSLEPEHHPEQNRFSLKATMTADRFGEIMQDRLLIVRPGLLAGPNEYDFTSRQRTSPVKLDAALRRDRVNIKIQEGFQLDNLPASARVESPYGSLQAAWAFRNGEIIFEQTLEVNDTIVPASEFPQVREFFDRIAAALAAPVVLTRQN